MLVTQWNKVNFTLYVPIWFGVNFVIFICRRVKVTKKGEEAVYVT